jgi:hypothetical protein
MTSDQKFTLWCTALAALPTIVFSGVIAYWNWRRDQERLVVQKSPVHWKTLDGTRTVATMSGVGIMIRNLSLYPIRISGMFLVMNGKQALAFDPDQHKEDWPREIASHARIVVYATDGEWDQLVRAGAREQIMEWKFQASVITETGCRFSSNRLSVRLLRPVRRFRGWLRRKNGRARQE